MRRRFHPREREAFSDGLIAGAALIFAAYSVGHLLGLIVELIAEVALR